METGKDNLRHNGSLRQELLRGLHALDLFQHLDGNFLTLKFPLPNLCQWNRSIQVVMWGQLVNFRTEEAV